MNRARGTYQPPPGNARAGSEAARMISSEQQQPMTAAEWANKNGRVAEFIRDVPSSCPCVWEWEPGPARFTMSWHVTGCPWHTGIPGRMP